MRRLLSIRPAVLLAVLAFALVLLLGWMAGSSRMAFRRWVCAPVPPSVDRIQHQGAVEAVFMPEPLVRIAFTASPADLQIILEQRSARLLSPEDDVPGWQGGPAWWPAIPSSRMTLYSLKGEPRIGSEFLGIDLTGTNAFYLLWGI